MPFDLGPPHKRARVELETDADEPGVQKDEQARFSDGSIVVVTANKIPFGSTKGLYHFNPKSFATFSLL